MGNLMFSEKLKQLRKAKHMTQDELATELNIARPTITRYERGDRLPTVENMAVIANYFGVTVDELAGIDTTIEATPIGTLSEDEEELLRLFRMCNEKNRAKAAAYVEGLLAQKK